MFALIGTATIAAGQLRVGECLEVWIWAVQTPMASVLSVQVDIVGSMTVSSNSPQLGDSAGGAGWARYTICEQ
jgi:hypothetical protein